MQGHQAAFPCYLPPLELGGKDNYIRGLTKRELFAVMLHAGKMSNPSVAPFAADDETVRLRVLGTIKETDALLAALEADA